MDEVSLSGHISTTVHLFGIHITAKTSICSSESNIDLHVCSQNSEACHMKKGSVSSVCGLWKKDAADLTS